MSTKTSPEVVFSGTDSYEWLSGEFFLIHEVDVVMGDDRNETIEIIGYDKQAGKFTLQHFDNKGNTGLMKGSYENGIWTYLGEALRFTGGFKNDGQEFSGVWEQSSDGKQWVHFMEIRLEKMS